uniref:Uncharacterized protein n=1 Tax=Hucho hucho TaxID=62062 RepID=A0A4W5KQT4_9TELE
MVKAHILSVSGTWYNILLCFWLLFSAKPISLVERCWCRSTLNTVPQRSIRELKFLHTPNCPFQHKPACLKLDGPWPDTYSQVGIN